MSDTIFDKIIRGEMKCWKVWEDEKHMAWLTPFPNTPGLTVLVPKENKGDYVFGLEDEVYHDLLEASKKVAKILEKAFNTPRVAMVFEGTGKLASETDVWSSPQEFYPEYVGYMTTVEGPKMSDEELDAIQQKIIDAQK
jgi:galactose-1-phosphate uridylyltransferase